MAERPSTPPPSRSAPTLKPDLTPEQVRRIEESRLRAKALRTQREAASTLSSSGSATLRTPSGFLVNPVAGQKRPSSALVDAPAATQRDARNNGTSSGGGRGGEIQAARKFTKYIDYDFSKMTDTQGGFLTADDDPYNKALHAPAAGQEDQRPTNMSVKEWERLQLLRKLRKQKLGPFEPGLSALDTDGEGKPEKGCAECGSLEIDFQWAEVFALKVCNRCKDRLPEKYSLLTKTEAKEDYLLTDPELKDEGLLRRLEKPNPHKREWNNMHLFLRCQVEEYAFSDKKWGSSEALDEEFAKRQTDKKKRKEEKFRSRLEDLKKRTRVEAYRRAREKRGTGQEAQFGESISRRGDQHEHEWGRVVTDQEGVGRKTCVECGMQVEELEF